MKKLIHNFGTLILSFVTLCFAVGALVIYSFSWFTNTEFVEPDLSGFSVSAYFGGGNGSPDNPFLIKNQRHLYNLSWLQYLGYFNKEGALDSDGRIITAGHAGELTQYSFEITQNLDMTNWNLPPIGTTLNPFIGLLNGNGYTITGLHTTNNFSEFGSKHPSSVTSSNFANAEIIGFVGVIGTIDGMRYSNYSIDTEANAVANIKLKQTQVRTSTGDALIGIAAGYINGTVEDVGIVNSGLYINSASLTGMDSISMYTVAGYATDGYLTRTSKTKAVVLNPTNTTKTNYVYENPGDSDAWGGSIDMASLYSRFKDQCNTRLTTYISDEIHYYNQNGTTYQNEIIINSTPVAYENGYGITDYYYGKYSGGSGQYLTLGTAPSRGYDYMTGLYKNVINITITGTTEGKKIKSPTDSYLNISSTRSGNTTNFNVSISQSTNSSTATAWIEETRTEGISLYTYNKDDGKKYYLNASTTAISLSVDYPSGNAWYYDSRYGYYIINNNVNYYLRHINGNWTISNKLAYVITDNQGNYLSRNNTNVENGTNYTQATRWIFEHENGVNGSYGAIYDESDTSYKLIINNNGNLVCSTTSTPTSWSNNGNNLYNDNKFIAYYNNAWRIYINNAKYIKYGNYYLTLNANGTINNTETDQDNASSWTFSNNDANPKGYLTTTIDETPYYLSFNNSNTNKLEIVTNQTQAIQWENDGDGAYYTYNNVKYYLQYKNNTWQAAQAATKKVGFYVKRGTAYFANQAVVFNFDSSNKLYYENNGTKTYVVIARTGSFWTGYSYALGESTSSTYALTRYTYNSNEYLRATYDSTYYLVYNNNNWNISTTTRPTNGRLTYEDVMGDDIENTPRPSIISNTNDVSYICDLTLNIPNMNVYSLQTNIYDRKTTNVPSVFNYVPLNTNKDHSVKLTNTGYIMAGGHSGSSGSKTLYGVDIRIAGEATAYSLSFGLSRSVNTSNGSIKQTNGQDAVYTFVTSGMKQLYQTGVTYEKYAASKTNLASSLQQAASTGCLAGIHFIDQSINMKNMVTAPTVLINGVQKNNYQMPENCIDFNLKTKGFINFFAGLYYPGNTSFFSLHQIKRDDDDKVIAINHIKEIYYNPNNKSLPYIYLFVSKDPTTNSYYSTGDSSLPNGYQMLFDTTWIESPTISSWDATNSGNGKKYMERLFYFEIPVNEGEYALGSVDGSDGGYLLYLDIGANAQQINRTEIRQKSTVTQYDYQYPNGIAIILESTTIDNTVGSTSLDASTSSSYRIKSVSGTQTIVANRTSNTAIDFATAITDGAPVYIPRTVTVTKNSGAVQAAAVRETVSTYSQIQYIDHNVTLGDIYETNIEQVDDELITYKIYKIGERGTTEGFERYEVDLTAQKPEWRLYAIDDVGGTIKNVIVDLTTPNSYGQDIIDALVEIAASTGNSVLEFDYDTVTGATNTYAIHINMSLDTDDSTGSYYEFVGNDINVTTNNNGGSTVYVTVRSAGNNNVTYTFTLNGTNMSVGTNITLPKTT